MADFASLDPAEVAKFSAIAAEWWDPAGKFAPLHKFNPVRLSFIRTEAAAHFGRDGRSLRPFEGLTVAAYGDHDSTGRAASLLHIADGLLEGSFGEVFVVHPHAVDEQLHEGIVDWRLAIVDWEGLNYRFQIEDRRF